MSSVAGSGITGRVLIGPTCPVERPGQPCVHGYRTTIVVYSAFKRQRITTFRSGSDGRFRVRLSGGRYRLESTRAGLPRLQPVSVTVRPHQYTKVTIRFDTGIR